MELLNRERILSLSKGQVTSPVLFVSGHPDPNGLFSEVIFGKTPSEQSRNFGHIELNCSIFTPHVFKMFTKAYRQDYDHIKKLEPYIVEHGKLKFLTDEELDKVDPQYVYYGIHGVITNLYRLKPTSSASKLKKEFWDVIEKFGTDSCIIDVFPVVPVKIRPYRSEFEYDALNDLYVMLLRLSQRIANIDKSNRYSYGVILTKIQQTVENIYEYLKLKTAKSKTSLVRGALLGKSVDFSARSVASVNPEIPPDYIGIPFRIVVSLFEPWLIREITRRLKLTIEDAVTILQKISKGFSVDPKLYSQIRQIAEQVVKDRYVIMKRDPDLHRGSIRSFKVKVVDDLTIQVHPTITSSFNLDFDGDSVVCKVGLHIRDIRTNDRLITVVDILKLKDYTVPLTQDRLFLYDKTRGNVDYYVPNSAYEVVVYTFETETGQVTRSRVLGYTVHKNLEMYKVTSLTGKFETFWVSSDHSLIVYDESENRFRKAKPAEILEKPERFYLVQRIGTDYQKIPCTSIDICLDPTVTVAADLTVQGTNTFFTYDGICVQDTVAVFSPLTVEAQEDARKMHSLIHSANPRRLMVEYGQEVKAGFCIMLSLNIPETIPSSWWWFKWTRKDGIDITEGRYRLYELLPEKYKEHVDLKTFATDTNLSIDKITYELLRHEVPQSELSKFVYESTKLALDVITKATTSLSLDHFELSQISLKYRDKLKSAKSELEKQEILDSLRKEVLNSLRKTDVGRLLDCGILKKDQLFQLLGAKGMMLSPEGNLALVETNFVEGLKPTQYFTASYGARNGIIYRVNKTATTGYLYRKLVYGLAGVQLDENLDYCGTTKTLRLENVSEKELQSLVNRYVLLDNRVTKITLNNMEDFVGKTLELFTPIYCTSQKICKRCFGDDYKLINTRNIGFVAAASIGERATQEMLKAFHVGGVVKPEVVDFYTNVSENTSIPVNELKQIFKQEQFKFYAVKSVEIIFDKEYYNLRYFKTDIDELPLSIFLAKARVGNKEIDIVYDGGINLVVPYGFKEDKEYYYLEYRPNDLVFKTVQEVLDMDRLANKMLATIEGRVVVKDERHLYKKLYRLIQKLGTISSVWIEILVSQLLRDSENPSLPARLGRPYKPKIVSIKEIPYLESWIRSVEFENFHKAVTSALLQPEVQVYSVLEDLL